MFTGIDKAIQDFIISSIGLATIFGVDLSNYQNMAVVVGVPLAKAFVTWWIPNKA